MKNLFANLLLLIFSFHCFSQDFIDQYDEDETEGQQFSGYQYDFTGEYQVILSDLFWNAECDESNPPTWCYSKKSLRIELVSFPFAPDCDGSCVDTLSIRTLVTPNFITLNKDLIWNSDYDVEIEGWGISFNSQDIAFVTEIFPMDEGLPKNISEPTTLITHNYLCDGIVASERLILPHSVLAFTLYFHDYTSEEIIDSLNWVLDNTRGRMKYYPFKEINGPNMCGTGKSFYDVTLFPKIHFDPDVQYYQSGSNSIWYNSPSLYYDNGSINYFPFSDIENSSYVTSIYPHYWEGGVQYPDHNYHFDLIDDEYSHPPQYTILNTTIRNHHGHAYAGYDDYANISQEVQDGVLHTYKINNSIPLDLINSTKKVIYNPSYSIVETGYNDPIIFPASYKFLTIHGKPPDRDKVEYWKTNYWPSKGYYFTDDRDVPVGIDDVSKWSVYEIFEESALLIEPGVIIMNTKFIGTDPEDKGTLKYYPDQTFGNFTISPDLKLIILSDNLEIDDSQTWENETVFQGSVINVENGATLTINKKLSLLPSGKIIVKRGGKLIIDGGTITGPNGWKGIEVWGNASQPQTYSYQGAVEIINEGTIENAVCGINTIRYALPENGTQESPDYYYTGGLVLCDGGKFTNNQTSVKFWRYFQSESASFFRNCVFTTDDNLIGAVYPETFIEMDDISGINIQACSFFDIHTYTSPEQLTTGIYSFNSKFSIMNYNEQPTLFSGLYDGVRAYSIDPAMTVSIINSTFNNNLRSVYLNTVMQASITGNEFNSWDGGKSATEESYCLYLDYCTDYIVEENEFLHSGTSPEGIGLVINNSGQNNNEIYNNEFTNLAYATLAQGNNRGSDPDVGLEILCNDYLSNYQDIAVTANILYLPGIAINQGAESNISTEQAGNRFSLNNNGNEVSDYSADRWLTINYYHHDKTASDEPRVEPVDYSDDPITPENQGTTFDKTTSCPSHMATGGASSFGVGELITQIITNEYKADSTQDQLSSLIDGGNTDELEQEVLSSMPQETYELYMSLMGNSPYLSDTVLIAAIEKENVLPNVLIKDILVANPQSAKSNSIMGKVEEKSNPMTQEMVAEVLMGKYIVAAKEKMESQVARYKHNRSRALKFLKQHYRNDTSVITARDSLFSLLESEEGIQEKIELAFAYGRENNWIVATNLLDSLPGLASFNNYQQDVYNDITQFVDLLSELSQPNFSFDSLTNSQKNTLYELADNTTNLAGSYARNLLIQVDDYPYQEPIILPEDEYKSGSIVFDLPNPETFTPDYIDIYPNPAKDYLIVELKKGNVAGAKLMIFDNQGRPAKDLNLPVRQQDLIIPIKDLEPGFYYLVVEINGEALNTKKFSKIN